MSVFILTQLPMLSYRIYALFLTAEELREANCGPYHYVVKTADILTVVNSSVNFLIYYPSAVTFRKTVSNLFRRIPYYSSRRIAHDGKLAEAEPRDNLEQDNT